MTAHLRRTAPAYLVLVLALVPSLFVYDRVRGNVRQQAALQFQECAHEVAESVQESLRQYTGVFNALAGLFEASQDVAPEEWAPFIDRLDIPQRHPGVCSIGYAPLVPGDDAKLAPGQGPASRGVSFPTRYLQQFTPCLEVAVGSDAMSDSARRAALERLLASGQPVLSAPILISTNSPVASGFTVYVPVYGKANAAGRRPLLGVVFSSFIPEHVLRSLGPKQLDPGLYAELCEHSDPATVLATSSSRTPPASPEFACTNSVVLFGTQFDVRVMSTPAFEAAGTVYLPSILLGVSLFFSVFLFGVAWTQVRARAAAEGLNRRLRASEENLLGSNRELERRIAEQNATEALLAHERDLLRTLLDHSPDRIYFKDRSSRFLKCGKAVIEGLALKDPAEAIGKTDFDFFTEEHARTAYEIEQEIIRSGTPCTDIIEKETWKDGRVTWVLTSKMPLVDKRGEIIGTFGTSKDITSFKRTEAALQKEKELLAVTLRSIADGVITTDMYGRIVLFNKVAEELTGWPQAEAVGTPLQEVYRIRSQAPLDKEGLPPHANRSGDNLMAPDRGSILVARDGTQRNVAESLAPLVDHDGKTIGTVLVFRDITEKLKVEADLLRASKLESIGVLAGGIAHDFNNILTVVLGNISLARMLDDKLPAQVATVLNEAEKASLRARDLTQRLLTFAKGGAPIKKVVSLGPLLRDCTKAALQGSTLNYQFFIADALWPVSADEAQLAQVFQNLIRHARNSTAETPVIDVHAANIELTSDPLMFLVPGKYVRISIRDHGPGLQPEQLNKVFDPYFSSKKPNGGLELATAYSIVRKHEGQIRVESISGQGTVFHVYLPAVDAPVETPVRVRERRLPSTGRILVMDDEASIRQLATTLLGRIGYTAVAVSDGAEAIMKYAAARRAGQPFDAVIMDLTIPNGMGGADAIRELTALDPGVRAIVSSGYSNDPVMANYRGYGFRGVVPKPYNAEDLAAALADVLAPDEGAPEITESM